MNQQKIGRFLKELRNGENLTQEQLAEILGVSNRSISRWENGTTMPDFDLLIQIAKHFDVEIEEILDGERKGEITDQKTEKMLLKVADYNSSEKMKFSKRLHCLFIAGLAAFTGCMILDTMDLTKIKIYNKIASALLGFVFGDLLIGTLYSSRYIEKIHSAKMRILKRIK